MKVLVCIVAAVLALYGALILGDIRNFETSPSSAAGISVIFIVFLLSIGDVFELVRLMWRTVLRFRGNR